MTMTNDPIRSLLANAALKRADQWQNTFVYNLPDPERFDEIVMLGAHSFALPESRRRLLKNTLVIQDNIKETPSAIARDFLRIEYKRGPRATKAQLERTDGIPPVPSYAAPQMFAHGFYIDIKACYWSIMQIVGWDTDYNPGFWLCPGRAPSAFPFSDHKVARNCLVSAGRLAGIPMFNPHRKPNDPYGEVKRGNPLQNNLLPRLIHDLLNTIAELCIEAGAIYVNNDGMITPDIQSTERCKQIITDFGLAWSVKAEGQGEVKASGTYSIGTIRTLTYLNAKNNLPLANIYPPGYKKWLIKEFTHLAGNGKIQD